MSGIWLPPASISGAAGMNAAKIAAIALHTAPFLICEEAR
jgi:hypothetical protein